MAAILSNLRNTVIAGFVLAALVFVVYWRVQGYDVTLFVPFLARWLHVLSGIMWIGLLYYFNFVATPTMPSIPDELKPALGKYITPAALFWFRWSAMSTIVFGIILAQLNGYLVQAYTLDAIEGFANPKALGIGIGMWLGTIMWFNVWFVIWPNQQKALNIGNKYPDLAKEAKAAAAKTAGQFSRVNTMLSIPMLFAMVAAQNIY
ncbi:MAG: urate hydroxylase PuuD [Proteobacteria bacterium]|nr:urate hydroxylase PuuD [Pseudomonadota bacterium]